MTTYKLKKGSLSPNTVKDKILQLIQGLESEDFTETVPLTPEGLKNECIRCFSDYATLTTIKKYVTDAIVELIAEEKIVTG